MTATIAVAAPTEDAVEAFNTQMIDWLTSLNASMLPLKLGVKEPSNYGWPGAPALTSAAALAHANAGGGMGLNCGASQLILLDAEDALAREWVMETLGYTPTVVTANAQVEGPKLGGAHFYLPVPDGVDSRAFTYAKTMTLPNGGKLEVLAGSGRFAVGPPTATAESGWHRYHVLPNAGGTLPTRADLPEAPAWLWDNAVPALAGAEFLHGVIAPRAERARIIDPTTGDHRTPWMRAVDDARTWDEVLAGDPRLQADPDAECGCPAYRWHRASNPKSLVTHEGCSFGSGWHAFSSTLQTDLGLEKNSGDRLSLYLALTGRDRSEVVREWGLPRGGPMVVTAEDFDADADGFELDAEGGETEVAEPGPAGTRDWKEVGRDGLIARATRCRAVAEAMRAEQRIVGTAAGEIYGTSTIAGGAMPLPVIPAVTGAVVAAALEPVVELHPAGGVEGEDGGLDETDAEDALVRGLRPAVAALERRLAALTPGMKRLQQLAESEGVFMSGLLVGLAPRVMAEVPPYVLLPPASALLAKDKGISVNIFGMPIAPTSAGKGVTAGVARACLRLTFQVREIPEGTAEGIVKSARRGLGADAEVLATSVLMIADEIDVFNAELARMGSKLGGFIRKAWMGERLGQIASDDKRVAECPPNSTRFGFVLYAQPHAVGPIQSEVAGGTAARFVKGLAGIEEAHGPLYGTIVAPLLANQERLPWSTPTGLPVGYPPRGDTVKVDAKGDDEHPVRDPIEVYDDTPAVWVKLSRGVRRAILAELQRSAGRAADWLLAAEQDEDGISGHWVIQQEKIAFFIAVLDGEIEVTDTHWAAAGIVMEIDRLVDRAAAIIVKRHGAETAVNGGVVKGIGRAAERAAQDDEAARQLGRAMDSIIRNLKEIKGHSEMAGNLTKKFSKRQKPYRAQAFQQLAQLGRIKLDGNRATLIG